ncbi:MAG: helix-turn-helix domain-containing protein [Actinomycetota bacterium]|nr:helix-turn-helix domain-containing protein [Actinomycetota bacterium]
MGDQPTGFDPELDIKLDARSLRGLTHPLRVQMLGQLRMHGPATASQLAERLGQSSGATSYHLRQLAAYGFIVEDTERGTERERWWRAAHRSTYFDSVDPDNRALGGEYLRAVARGYSDRLLRFADSVETVAEDLGDDWDRAHTMSDWLYDLTAEQAAQLNTELEELADRYRTDGPAEGTRRVVLQVQLFPLGDQS